MKADELTNAPLVFAMLFDTRWTYTKLRATFPCGGRPDVCQSGLPTETGNYCFYVDLYM